MYKKKYFFFVLKVLNKWYRFKYYYLCYKKGINIRFINFYAGRYVIDEDREAMYFFYFGYIVGVVVYDVGLTTEEFFGGGLIVDGYDVG